MSMKVAVTKIKRGKVVTYSAHFGGSLSVEAPTKDEAISKCERLVFAMCEDDTPTILTFGRYVATVWRYRPDQYEYTIIDMKERTRYGRVMMSCSFVTLSHKEAVGIACSAIAQRAADDCFDTELLAAILSYMLPEQVKQFHDWREQTRRLKLERQEATV